MGLAFIIDITMACDLSFQCVFPTKKMGIIFLKSIVGIMQENMVPGTECSLIFLCRDWSIRVLVTYESVVVNPLTAPLLK